MLSVAAGGLVWGVLLAGAQESRVIRPSPAYYQQQGLAVPAEGSPAQPPVVSAPAAPVRPAVQPAPAPQPQAQPMPRPLPPHPRSGAAPATAAPAAAMTPLAVQPRPIQPAAASAAPAAPMTPLPVQPRPIQPAARPLPPPAPMPVPVQPRMVQPAVQPVPVQPVQPVPMQPVVHPQPIPARAVQPMVAPVAQPMPVPPVAAPEPAQVDTQDQIYFPSATPTEPVRRGTPGTRLQLAQTLDDEGEWVYDDVAMDGGYRWPGLALGPRIGTTGIGADLTFGLTRYLNLRSGFHFGSFSVDKTFGGVKYDTALEMIGVPLLVDLYPAGGHFRLTGGVFLQPSMKADLEATPGSPVQIGNHAYGPDVVGTLTGKIEGSALAPYVGIGFGNAVGEDQWLTFSLDIGVALQTYDVSLASDGAGMTAKLDTFREDMKKEEKNLQKDADNFKFYPVLSLGISYHF